MIGFGGSGSWKGYKKVAGRKALPATCAIDRVNVSPKATNGASSVQRSSSHRTRI